MSTVIRNARVLTLAGPCPVNGRRGAALNDLRLLPSADVLISGHMIEAVGPALSVPGGTDEFDARGRVLMPGFVDAHTHACFAGSRLDEWERKLCGATYLEILKMGGGIHATVRAVRAASEESLAESLLERLERMLAGGTTTVEVKSGYGLDAANELKMLRAIAAAGRRFRGSVRATALLGHAFEGDAHAFARSVIDDVLPRVSAEFPAIPVDAFCEEGAWSLDDTVALMEDALRLGHPLRVHADQFHALGMLDEAVRLGARSVDHLEATDGAGLRRLAGSSTFGVMLPATAFHTGGRSANGRAFVDAGGAPVVATNFNPGSSPTQSMPFAIALAVRQCGLSVAEAISGATVNAAALLGFFDRGRIAPGLRADLVLLCHRDERELAHTFGGNPVDAVWCVGTRAV